MREIDLQISGLGIILYSPFAVDHIPEGADYLIERFWRAEDIAKHVMACQLTTFCTGTPGDFRLRFLDGPPDDQEAQTAEFKLRLGLEVRGGVICIRDLYDLMRWTAECPDCQQLPVPDGWYRLSVYSSSPPSGILGDDQLICICLERVANKPNLHWVGCPLLCD